jgi:hypothetical protein
VEPARPKGGRNDVFIHRARPSAPEADRAASSRELQQTGTADLSPDEEAGDVFHLVADEVAADALAAATTPCRVILGLRASSVRLAGLSRGNVKVGLPARVLTAALDSDAAAPDEKRSAR